MNAASIDTAGEHFTIVAANQLGSAVATASWKTGAIMGFCSRIDMPDASPGKPFAIRFACANSQYEQFLAAITSAMRATGPVNVGLTDEKRDGLRAVFYFPDEGTAHHRMQAAVAAVGAGA